MNNIYDILSKFNGLITNTNIKKIPKKTKLGDMAKTISESRSSTNDSMSEGYKVMPGINRERYTDLSHEGLEGPFTDDNGRVVYYDPQEGKYYDRDRDMYLDYDEVSMRGGMGESSVSQAQARMMAGAAHNPKFAKKVGVDQSVAREFNKADTGTKISDLPNYVDEAECDVYDSELSDSDGVFEDSMSTLLDRLVDESYGDDESEYTLDQDQLIQHVGEETYNYLKDAVSDGYIPVEYKDELMDYFQTTGELSEIDDENFDLWAIDRLKEIFGVDGIDGNESNDLGGDQFDDNTDVDMELDSGELGESNVIESASDNGCDVDHIRHNYPHEVKKFVSTGVLDNDLYAALYDHYKNCGEIPSGILKGRDGSPHDWIHDRFSLALGIRTVTPMTSQSIGEGVSEKIEESKSDYMKVLSGTLSKGQYDAKWASFNESVESYTNSGVTVNANYDSATGEKALTVTATGETADALSELLSLSGLVQPNAIGSEEISQEIGSPVEIALEEVEDPVDDERYKASTTPDPKMASIDAMLNSGNDLNRKKKQYADKPRLGDNPMATESIKMTPSFKKAYESIKLKNENK